MQETYKVIAEVSIKNKCAGKAEIIDMQYKDGKLNKLLIKWIVVSSCQGSPFDDEIIARYHEVHEYKADEIFCLKNLETMAESRIEKMRQFDCNYEIFGKAIA